MVEIKINKFSHRVVLLNLARSCQVLILQVRVRPSCLFLRSVVLARTSKTILLVSAKKPTCKDLLDPV